MRNYEVTFIVDPVLSGDEIKKAAETYKDLLKDEECSIVAFDDLGLKQLAYSIKKRNSGVYHKIEFESPTGAIIPKLELSLRRDERIIRFLTVALDKYGVKYNADKRNGLIGKVEKKTKDDPKRKTLNSPAKQTPAPAPVEEPKAAEPTPTPAKAEEE